MSSRTGKEIPTPDLTSRAVEALERYKAWGFNEGPAKADAIIDRIFNKTYWQRVDDANEVDKVVASTHVTQAQNGELLSYRDI